MSEIKDGGPAFPVSTNDPTHGHQDGPNTWQHVGLSLRDYFAAKAMQAEVSIQGLEGNDCQHIADCAYEMANAMLRAREAKP